MVVVAVAVEVADAVAIDIEQPIETSLNMNMENSHNNDINNILIYSPCVSETQPKPIISKEEIYNNKKNIIKNYSFYTIPLIICDLVFGLLNNNCILSKKDKPDFNLRYLILSYGVLKLVIYFIDSYLLFYLYKIDKVNISNSGSITESFVCIDLELIKKRYSLFITIYKLFVLSFEIVWIIFYYEIIYYHNKIGYDNIYCDGNTFNYIGIRLWINFIYTIFILFIIYYLTPFLSNDSISTKIFTCYPR
jgi:hypothetical protein